MQSVVAPLLSHLPFSRHYFVATAAIYVPCFCYPWLRTFFEYGLTQKAYLNVEENGFTRITIPSVSFKWTPGQHCFLRFTSFGIQALSSHPFTICSLPSPRPNERSELVFYIRHQRGLTEKLYQHALEKPGASVSVLIDGPYGGINMQRYIEADRLLVIAGGSGAGWILPFIELFQKRAYVPPDEEHGAILPEEEKASEVQSESHRLLPSSGQASLRVILATRETNSRVWFLRAVGGLLSRGSGKSTSDVNVQVHLTGEADQNAAALKEGDVILSSDSASSTEHIDLKTGEGRHESVPGKERHGRPDLPRIIHEEAARAAEAGQSLSVFICGPTTMQNDVRNAVAKENLHILRGTGSSGVYLHAEHFSWA